MKNTSIKAVIFDADGPLYYRTPEVLDQQLALLNHYGYPDKLEHHQLAHVNKYGHLGNLGKFNTAYEAEKFKTYAREQSELTMARHILHTLGLKLPNSQLSHFVAQLNRILSHITARPDALPALQALKTAGYQTCVLTDSFHPSAQKWRWFKAIGLAPYLDYIISSYDIRRLKNTPKAYQACLKELGSTADQTVFVGHQSYEMTGARQAGIRCIALTPIAPADIKADYGINSLTELPHLLKQLS